MSSPYPVLNNRPIDQWKVTELKDELRRRKMPIKGLKDDLVRRLDEALRNEMAMTEQDDEEEEEGGNGIGSDSGPQENGDEDEANLVVKEHSDVVADTAVEISSDQKTTVETVVTAIDVNQSIEDQVEDAAPVEGSNAVEFEDKGIITESEAANVEAVGYRVSKEESVPECQSLTPQHEPTFQGSVYDEEHKDKCLVEATMPTAAAADNQVSEVTEDLGPQVKCESISTDSVSINETNKLKDNSNADNFDLELEVKPAMVQPSSGDLCVGGDVHPLDVDKELVKKEVSSEEIDDKGVSNMDSLKEEDSADVGSPEKLNLDRSSGDDSMDEDVTESKPTESRLMSDEKGGTIEISKGLAVKGETLAEDIIAESSDKKDAVVEEETKPPAPVEKRNLEDKEAVGNNETFKRQRRWNSENAKPLEPQKSNRSGSDVLKDVVQPTSKHTLTGPDKAIDEDSPKERIVPPSQRPATTSLRIDRFVRPFTLKAVQELLAKNGPVCSFWMDHIKTHCYVTYSSVEDAVKTRDAVYNLQWPPNNGNRLIAEFVDPNEVKLRVEAPLQSPAPVSPSPTTPKAPLFQQPETSQSLSRQQALKHKQQLPLAAPPPQPPLLSDPPSVRERLRPPPTPPAKHEPPPPAVTLDDLFKKTKTGPRIYYLPLSEEQVAAKLAAQGKSTVD